MKRFHELSNKNFIWMVLAISLLSISLLLTCDLWGTPDNPLDPKSDNYAGNAKAITAFSFSNPQAIGIISEADKRISITVPYGSNVTALAPTIGFTGVSISPASGAPQDFSNPVTYTVTAADSSIQTYTVSVTVALNSAKMITSFSFSSLSVAGIIDQSTHSIAVTIPYGTSVAYLAPTILIDGSTVSPPSGSPQNFTSAVTYTVTAADSTTQNYTVTVTAGLNPSKTINSFNFTSPAATGVITESNHRVAITVPYGTSVISLAPTIGITGVSVHPSSGAPQNFSSPVTYTVTAADSTTQDYTVTVTVGLNPAKAITSFNFTGPAAIGMITESTHTVAITAPFGTSVTSLAPTIAITGASIFPPSGVPQNFTSPVTYTVTAADESTQAYIVTVEIGPQYSPDIYVGGFSTNSSGVDIPGYWKNGIWVELPSPGGNTLNTWVTSLAISGTDVYAGGIYFLAPSNNSIGGYWKNGIWNQLPSQSITESYINTIFISGTDLYVGGTNEISDAKYPGYWGNGTWVQLPKLSNSLSGSEVWSIFISESDVYAGGYSADNSNNRIPGYWKNGAWVQLSNISQNGLVYSLIVSGMDVHAGGDCYNSSDNIHRASYWKNSTQTYLPSLSSANSSCVFSLFMNGSDVYAGGYCQDSSNKRFPGYWKNGTWEQLPSLSSTISESYVKSIFVYETDVYAVGRNTNDSNVSIPGYWKNGTWIDLPGLSSDHNSFCFSIIVQ